MTEESFRSSNQRIEDERQSKKQKTKNHFKKPPFHNINRSHLGGPAAVADMGPYANGYDPPPVNDYMPNVRSDL
jgi:hypothetical protein